MNKSYRHALILLGAILMGAGLMWTVAQEAPAPMPGPAGSEMPPEAVEPPAPGGDGAATPAAPAPAPAAEEPMIAVPAATEEAPAVDTASADTGFLTIEEASPVEAAEPAAPTSNLISITLDDVEILDVVRMFTRISGANIIATPSNLQGRVTVNLSDVEWKPALESILDMHALALQEKLPGSGVYSVVPRPPGTPDPMKVETFFLDYATVANVEPVVKGMLTQGAGVTVYPSQNALVVRSTAANLGEIRQVVADIDIPREQVFIEAKFMELDDSAIRDLGINWQSLDGYALGASSLTRTYTSVDEWQKARNDETYRFNQLRETFTDGNVYDQYGDLLVGAAPGGALESQLDPVSDRPDPAMGAGINTRDSQDRGAEAVSDITDVFTRTITDARSAVLGAADFQLILSALKQMAGVSVVSNPKIIVANEEPASIHIGQTERPFVSSVTPGQQGIAPVVTYNPGDPVDLGVKLTVTPTVNTASNITVKIEPELTRFIANAVAPNGQTYPIIATKKITTVFALESGKTVAIGGLTETTDRDVNSKIPLLGDIPLLGKYLFSHSHKEKAQSETIIFVTVGLATPNTLLRESGLPENTMLTQRQLIRQEAEQRSYREELEDLARAAEEDRARQATREKAALLQRDD